MIKEPLLWINPEYAKAIYPLNVEDITKWLSLTRYRFMHQPPIDRTKTIEEPFNFDMSLFSVPTLNECKQPIGELCINRAHEIYSAANNNKQKIMLFFSGGVDSTSMLCSFIEAVGLDEASRIIEVVMTNDSINENPNFYWSFIKPNFKTVDLSELILDMHKPEYVDYFYVSGDPGGGCSQGGEAVRSLVTILSLDEIQMSEVLLSKPDKKYIEYLFPARYSQHVIDAVYQTTKNKNFEIKTLHDFTWWYAFNFRYVAQCMTVFANFKMLLSTHPKSGTYWVERLLPFYNTPRFQQWCCSYKHFDVEYFAKGESTLYKKHLKEFIYSFNKDRDYMIDKDKGPNTFATNCYRNSAKIRELVRCNLIYNDFTVL